MPLFPWAFLITGGMLLLAMAASLLSTFPSLFLLGLHTNLKTHFVTHRNSGSFCNTHLWYQPSSWVSHQLPVKRMLDNFLDASRE